MKNSIIILLFVIGWSVTSAQNNPIFNGGSGDGMDKTAYAQAANNIYAGGNGDGWNYANFLQPGNNIFQGNTGDGWGTTNYSQAGNNIFNGGIADGWASTTFLQSGNDIFNGGNGDGWNNTNFLQAGNNIFTGGIGDGWSSTYRPMGTIPVNFVYFNAQKQSQSTALLNWKTSQETNSARFEVERSVDAVNFSWIGNVAAAGNSQVPSDYYFTDFHPEPGINYYRLKQVDVDGHFIYTVSRLVKFDADEQGAVKYFPNPTQGILNIELPASMLAEKKIINISNVAGNVLDQFRLEAGTNNRLVVNMNKFPKGIYFIQVKTASSNSVQRIVLQ